MGNLWNSLIKKTAGMSPEESQRVVITALKSEVADGKTKRIKDIEKCVDFYDGDQTKYLKPNQHEERERWLSRPKVAINMIGPIADRKSGIVYKGRVKRTVSDSAATILQPIWTANKMDMFMGSVDLTALLTGVCLVRPCAVDAAGHKLEPGYTGARAIKYRHYPGDMVDLVCDPETGEMGIVHLSWGVDTVTGKSMYEQIWTPTWFWERIDNVEKSGENPYGFIPFVCIHEHGDDYCLDGKLPLLSVVELNHNLNGVMTDLEWLVKMQAHGQPYGTGLGAQFKPKSGPGQLWNLPEGSTVGILNPNSKISETIQLIERLRASIYEVSGVPEAAINPQQAQTGISLKVQLGPLFDYRSKKINCYRAYEQELAELTLRVMTAEGFGVDPNMELEFAIDYDDKPFDWMDEDTMDAEQVDLANNLTNPIKLLRKRNPDLTDEEAEAEIKKNQELNAKYRGGGLIPSAYRPTEFEKLMASFGGGQAQETAIE